MDTRDIKDQAGFEKATKEVIKWLNENMHPHAKVVIDQTSAELVEGLLLVSTEEFIKD